MMAFSCIFFLIGKISTRFGLLESIQWKTHKFWMILVIAMTISFIIPLSCHQMIIKSGFHLPAKKKNGDNYEQEDECILNDDHGVTNLTRSIAREDDYRYEEN